MKQVPLPSDGAGTALEDWLTSERALNGTRQKVRASRPADQTRVWITLGLLDCCRVSETIFFYIGIRCSCGIWTFVAVPLLRGVCKTAFVLFVLLIVQ